MHLKGLEPLSIGLEDKCSTNFTNVPPYIVRDLFKILFIHASTKTDILGQIFLTPFTAFRDYFVNLFSIELR